MEFSSPIFLFQNDLNLHLYTLIFKYVKYEITIWNYFYVRVNMKLLLCK